MSKRGQLETLSESKKREVLSVLTIGCSRQVAARYANCDPKAIANTARCDAAFADQLARAEHAVEVAHFSKLYRLARQGRYPQASAWALGRTFADRCGVELQDSIAHEQAARLVEQIVKIFAKEMTAARRERRIQEGGTAVNGALRGQQANGGVRRR